MQKINNWLIANGLKLNTNKSKYMIFSKPNKNIPVLQLCINNVTMDELQNFNFLGLQVSSDIAWNLHINISHTEPLFKFYDILKVNDIYRYKLLNLYYNAKKSNIPIYISTFVPDLSQGARKYEIRNPRLQSPVHIHEYITETCRYQLALLLNEINSIVETLDPLKSVVSNILNVTLLGLKHTVKSYLLQKYSYYCVIPNCYVCQSKLNY